jgi:predicted metalloprotease with PDZ domain
VRVHEKKVGRVPVTILVQGTWGFDDARFVGRVVDLLDVQIRYMGSLPNARLLAVLCTGPEHTVGGTALTDAAVFRAGPGKDLDEDLLGTVSHELFHLWLGHAIRVDGESVAWFHEGFTVYLAHWFVVAAKLKPPSWFVASLRMKDAAARRSEAALEQGGGRVPAFADRDVDWRGSAELETLAYEKGALLACLLDGRLRDKKKSLADLLRAFYGERETVHGAGEIRNWLAANGLSDFHRRHVAAPDLPGLAEILAAAGLDGDGRRGAAFFRLPR